MADIDMIAERYRQFADQEAHGSSPSYEAWSRTIMQRSTQTNEPARCAVLLPLLHQVGGPVALIELGAAAGLCLIPDRYSYAYSDGTVVHPPDGPSDHRRPGHRRLAGNPGLARARAPPPAAFRRAAPGVRGGHRIERGNLLGCLARLVAEVPAGATPVVLHSATLAYLDTEERAAAAAAITGSGARWISFEGRGVVTPDRDVPGPVTPDTLFVAALDRAPSAVASGHGDTMTLLRTRS